MIAAGKTCLLLGEGEYTYNEDYFVLEAPVIIIGQGREKTTLVEFGLRIQGSKSNGTTVIEDLKIKIGPREREEGNAGLWAHRGMDLITRRCTVEKCNVRGVRADGAHISCNDLQVVDCKWSGVLATNGGTIKFSGEGTCIKGNAVADFDQYGVYGYSSSKIQFVAPLTKARISTNNDGGRNWGGGGTVEQVVEQISNSQGETKSSDSTRSSSWVKQGEGWSQKTSSASSEELVAAAEKVSFLF